MGKGSQLIILGLSGAFGLPGETFIPNLPRWFFHDSAAALLRDGEVLAAVEEERVTRVKHTNTLAVGATIECLDIAQVDAGAIEAVAYFFREDYADTELGLQYAENPDIPLHWARELLVERLSASLGRRIDPAMVHFVPHHLAHAYATYHHSGFKDALVAIVDGNGEEESISIFAGRECHLDRLWVEPPEKSPGHLYCLAIELLGYTRFEEYKVMALASSGDRNVFRQAFDELVHLESGGQYTLNVGTVRSHFLRKGFRPRRARGAIDPVHCDFAAGLQDCLERLALHLLSHWQRITGLTSLCIAGGVGLNCSMNGRIAQSGLFERMFVHPASHDAGAAVGAALVVEAKSRDKHWRSAPLRDVAWGMDISAKSVERLIKRWSLAIDTVAVGSRIIPAAADCLASGRVLGWARGRMEFGPRALGQRSILADPRPLANRDRINAVIKQRESYRPFAPMVRMDDVSAWFQLSDCACNLAHMVFSVPVRVDRRHLLQAVTHVDGSARLQVVDPMVLPDVASLLDEFADRTGVPVLLNTSFNVNSEPIVARAGEALLCFLTTGLDALVLGDYLLTRRDLPPSFWLDLVPVPRLDVTLVEYRDLGRGTKPRAILTFTWTGGGSLVVPPEATLPLSRIDGRRSFRACGFEPLDSEEAVTAASFIRSLLELRLIRVAGLDVPE